MRLSALAFNDGSGAKMVRGSIATTQTAALLAVDRRENGYSFPGEIRIRIPRPMIRRIARERGLRGFTEFVPNWGINYDRLLRG